MRLNDTNRTAAARFTWWFIRQVCAVKLLPLSTPCGKIRIKMRVGLTFIASPWMSTVLGNAKVMAFYRPTRGAVTSVEWAITSCRHVVWTLQKRIQEFAKGGPVLPVLFLSPSSLPFPSPSLPFPLDVGPLKPALWSGGALSAPPVGPGAEFRPKTNLVHSKAVRKPLVAIILNILSTMVYSRKIKIYH